MKNLASRTNGFGDSIFAVMSEMARNNNAINLSQGFPDFDGPKFLSEYAVKNIEDGNNQYASFMGVRLLREKLANKYQNEFKVQFDIDREITITNGATEAIYSTIQAIVNPGDEVIVFEPTYDSYVNSIKLAGGTPIPVTLHAPDFNFDETELKNAFSNKTKMVIINTPHNPSGKVFTKEELSLINKFAIDNDTFIMSDEVYEYLVFDGKEHISLCSFDEIRDRLILISSAGKTFGMTGWKVGWAITPEVVTNSIRKVHQYITFSISTPFQYAVAQALDHIDEYKLDFQKTYLEKRDLFYKGLKDLGFDFSPPSGTYFMLVPIDNFTKKNDVEFAKELIEKYKVAMIPPSAFYLKSDEGQKFLRLCFAKSDKTIQSALENLKGLKS